MILIISPMPSEKKKLDLEVAIVGGGFAGVYCGQSLGKTLGRGTRIEMGIVSDENYMVFQPMLPEVASGSISPRHVVNPIRHLCKGLQVYKARVECIDIKNKQLTLSPGDFSEDVIIRFRHLVIALGAKIDLSRVPGMAEHSLLMQNVGDAMKLRSTLLSRFEEANLVKDTKRRRRLLTFVVVGGGYSGVETAGQILDLFDSVKKYYKTFSAEDFSVQLVHSRTHVLPTLSERLGIYAEKKLRERGLNFHLEKRVKAVTANQVILNDGTTLETNTVVSTVGNSPHPLVMKLAEETGAETLHGRIVTKDTMQVPGYDWLWAAGDCAAVPMENGETCPSTAQFAMRQGALLGKNLDAFLRAEEVKPFTFKGLGELAAIGHHTAVAEVMGLQFSGFFAWWMWRTIYLSKLPGLDRKLRVLIDWTLDLFFPRDINLLSPRYSKAFQEAFLEEGDVLFNAGEPAFSFYIVKTGCIEIMDTDGRLIKRATTGEFFGERAMLAGEAWRFTATASEKTTLLGLGSEEFKAILQNSTSMRQLLERSARRYRSVQEIDAMKATLPPELLARPASDLMSTDVESVLSTDTIGQTLQRFNKERHSFYPLLHPDSKAVEAVIAREDFYDHIQLHGLKKESLVSEVSCCELPCVPSETLLADCLEAMVRSGRNKLLITDEANKLVGMVTIRDVLAAA